MRLCLLILFLLLLNLNAQDLHPEIRALVFESLDLSKSKYKFRDRNRFQQDQAAEILSRAGYIADAERILKQYFPEVTETPYYLWQAWVVFGHSQRVDAYLASLKNPNTKIGSLNAYASLLWRLGDKPKAKQTYLAAQALLPRVTDPTTRANQKTLLTQGLKFVDDDAPKPVSTRTIALPGRSPIPSLTNRFPISPNRATKQTPTDRESSTAFDEKTIQEIYSSLRKGNLQALDQIVASSQSPFQKALALASVQHTLNQLDLGDYSEACAQAIPSSDDDSKLAKAEALGSAATILIANGAKNRARALLISAVDLAASVPALLIPRLEILGILAMRQVSGGFEADARDTYTRAIEIGSSLPFAPAIWNHRKQSIYREDAIWKLISTAVEYNYLALAEIVVESNPNSNHAAIDSFSSALFRFGFYERALATARSIPEPHHRSQKLLDLASSWLDEINAPNF